MCAILIASMGALGMVCLAVARREKEIALRRVMGASSSKIAGGLVFAFATPSLAAVLVALPIAYLLISPWLSNFPYRVEVGGETVLSAVLLGVLVPIAGGFLHSFRVSSRNPLEALRED